MWLSMKNFNVSEIFDSIEGEGKRTGYMTVFVRLSGCNLRCSYCDTKYAQVRGQEDTVMSEDELIKKIKTYPWKRVTLTGGEPLLHDVESLVNKLSVYGYEVNIETNGAVPLLRNRPLSVFYTMDWKCPSSGENSKMLEINLKRLSRNDVLKFVVGSKEDLEEAKKIISNCYAPLIYISPVFNEIEPVEIVNFIKENKLQRACMQIQLHKVIWDPNERGV